MSKTGFDPTQGGIIGLLAIGFGWLSKRMAKWQIRVGDPATDSELHELRATVLALSTDKARLESRIEALEADIARLHAERKRDGDQQ